MLLLLLSLLLLISTKFKGENAYAAFIIVFTTVPVYLYNVCRTEEWYNVALWLSPLAFSVNTMLMPLLWLFVRRNFDSKFKFNWVKLLHFLPTIACTVIYCFFFFSLTPDMRFEMMIYENTGDDTWLGDVNAIVVFVQMFVYFILMFIYMHRIHKVISENLSESEWLYKMWIPKFILLFACLFLVVFVGYILWPRTDAWLPQLLNICAMSYLVYNAIKSADVPQVEDLTVRSASISSAFDQESQTRAQGGSERGQVGAGRVQADSGRGQVGAGRCCSEGEESEWTQADSGRGQVGAGLDVAGKGGAESDGSERAGSGLRDSGRDRFGHNPAECERDSDESIDIEQLKRYADDMVNYLNSSEAFLNPNLTLQEVAVAMNVSPKRLSKSINTILGKTFFEMINGLRIEKAKRMLPGYKSSNQTLDSISSQCGFNSSITFSNVFKKMTGVTPAKWES